MSENKAEKSFCKSIFKNGSTLTSKDSFTRKWIEYVNAVIKGKGSIK